MDLSKANKIEEVRKAIWFERLLYFPIKLIVAYLIYANFEHGLFIVAMYVLYRQGELAARQYINAEELNFTLQSSHASLGDHFVKQHETFSERLSKLERVNND